MTRSQTHQYEHRRYVYRYKSGMSGCSMTPKVLRVLNSQFHSCTQVSSRSMLRWSLNFQGASWIGLEDGKNREELPLRNLE